MTATALALGACGAVQPQVPGPQAEVVASALAGIAQTCGESHQVRALEPSASEARRLEAHATHRAAQLAAVYRQGPEWVYQGNTLRQIVALSVRYLRECDLPGAAMALERATSKPR